MQARGRSIKLVDFEEDLTPTGRKILTVVFTDKFSNNVGSQWRYRWVAPWRDNNSQREYGVERLFLKALEIEEWNDPEGAWSKELRGAAARTSDLQSLVLPIRIELGSVREGLTPDFEPTWDLDVEIVSAEENVGFVEDEISLLYVGQCGMDIEPLFQDLRRIGVEWIDTPQRGWFPDYGPDVWGVTILLTIKQVSDTIQLEITTREIASHIRRFIRQRLSVYYSLKRGFADSEETP